MERIHLTEEQIAEGQALRNAGESYTAISKVLGCAPSTAYRALVGTTAIRHGGRTKSAEEKELLLQEAQTIHDTEGIGWAKVAKRIGLSAATLTNWRRFGAGKHPSKTRTPIKRAYAKRVNSPTLQTLPIPQEAAPDPVNIPGRNTLRVLVATGTVEEITQILRGL